MSPALAQCPADAAVAGALTFIFRTLTCADRADMLALFGVACSFNKAYVPVFFYHTLRYMWTAEKQVMWAPGEISVLNTIVATPLLFIVYDFFYSFFY